MTYYDEFGLEPHATQEEIRQAYRNLSRLLHPDQQSDETLQRLAEAQMKRLNAIHKTLSDPARRRQYDLSLLETTNIRRSTVSFVVATPDIPAAGYLARRWRVLALWVSAAFVAMTALFWSFRDVPRGGGTHAFGHAAASPAGSGVPAAEPHANTGADGGDLRALRRQLDAVRKERDGAYEEISRLRAAPPAYAPAEVEMLTPLTVPAAVPARDPEALPGPERRSFAGTWFYARPKVDTSGSALYRPLFIEAVIVEEGGVLRGRYRARYQVADRAISPDVAFHLQAPAGGDIVGFSWSGAGGAKGEGSLRLVGENSMEVKWTALELGAQMGLASGTALLIRRQEH